MIHIVIEGMDGTGKSTLTKALFERLCGDGNVCRWVYQTKEPGLQTACSPGISFIRPGLDVREIVLNDKNLTALERELLFYVDASQHKRFIDNQGSAVVVSDRGLWSHYAYLYATMKTKQINYEDYLILKNLVNRICPKPSAVIYLKGSVELMKERNANKIKDVIESSGDDFFNFVQLAYEELEIEPKGCDVRLVLDARNSTCKNVDAVISFLREVYTDEELKSGNIDVCQK